jgi:ATP-dependent Clp protease ATP-binding subunit ClpC
VNEYKRHIEKDAALERRFQAVTVGEPSESEAIHILEGLRDKYEAHHQLRISDGAIKAAVNLSKRYISDRFLPDKAIDLIDEAASKLRLAAHTTPPLCLELEGKMTRLAQEKEAAIRSQSFESAAALRDEEKQIQAEYQIAKAQWDSLKTENSLTVTEQDIADIVTQWTGIPLNELVKDDNEKLLQMENRLNQMVIGQSSAIEALSRAIRRGRLGLKDPRRPIGSFLFLGPTGVGKTELTKALSFVLFGDVNAMIRLDMSEYMEKHSISKLIGSPPGYIGYDEGGQLTEKVRRRPYSVILFDEIEKGHPDVFHLLLQILEDGVLTDAQGRHVNFKNTILIMTSNLGASSLDFEKKVGFSSDFAKTQKELLHDHTMRELKRFFRPEFLNRIDETIIFNSLSQEDVKQIALNMLNELSKRVRENIRIELEYDEKTVDLIVEKGYDATNGARPLRRAIMYYIEDRLSDAVLRGEVTSGSKIRLTCENGKINFQKM